MEEAFFGVEKLSSMQHLLDTFFSFLFLKVEEPSTKLSKNFRSFSFDIYCKLFILFVECFTSLPSLSSSLHSESESESESESDPKNFGGGKNSA